MFDPYHKWLGIAPKDQPPNHYRLLAIELLEADPEVIDAAANRQMAYLQQRATGEYAAVSQKLLNEIAAARLCLLTPETKAAYDAQLRQRQESKQQVFASADAGDLLDGLAGIEPAGSSPLPPPLCRKRRLHGKPWHWTVAIGILSLFCLGMLALITSGKSAPAPVAVSQVGAQVADLENKIAKWQNSRDKLRALLDQLRQDKAVVLEKLDQANVRSDADLGNDPKFEVLAQELKSILRDAALYEKKHKEYELAILKSESRLRSIARRLTAQGAGLTDTELEDLSRSMITLDESLKTEDKVTLPGDLDGTLQKELASYRQARPGGSATDSPAPASKPSDVDLKSDAPAIYNVTVIPPDARLEASYDKVMIAGEGQARQVIVTSKPPNGYVRLTASYPGFESVEKWLTPSLGLKAELSIELKRSGENPSGSGASQASELRCFHAHSDYVTHVAVSPDGRFLASGGNDRTVQLRDLVTGAVVWKYTNLSSNVFALSFSPEGNRVWVCSRDSVKRLDTADGSVTKEFSISTIDAMNMSCAAFGLGCSRLATTSKGEVRVYDLYRRQFRSQFTNLWTPAVMFSPDGTRLAGGGNEGPGEVVLGDPETRKILRTYRGLRDRTTALAFSRDSKYLAAASGPSLPRHPSPQNKVIVWDVSTGKCIREWTVPTGWQWALAFSLDSRLLVAGGGGTKEDWFAQRSADTSIRIWDVATGREVQCLTGHTAGILALAPTPDGKKMISGSADRTVRVWRLPD